MSITRAALLSWLRQPTTIAGLATLAGIATSLALHETSVELAFPLIVAAIVGLALPDNSAARAGASLLAVDALAVARAPGAATVGKLVGDAVGLAVAVEQPSGSVATVAVTAPSVAEAAPVLADAVAVAQGGVAAAAE